MSKSPTDKIELQRIISNGGDSGNGTTMSTSGSFSANTDVSPVGPVYSTVPDAQTAHNDYHRRSQKKGSPTSYQAPGEAETPNTYDIIPENQQHSRRLVRSVSPVVVADNVLYGDQYAADQMKHKALTMEKGEEYQQKYSGSTSHAIPSESKDGFVVSCKCKTLCTFASILVVFFVAVAALVLSLIILLGVYSVCDCGGTSQEFAELQTSVAVLQSEVQTLRESMGELRSDAQVNITAVTSELSQLNNNLDSIRENVSQAANDVINQRITEDGTIIGLNYSVELSGVQLYEGCETTVPVTCNIDPPPMPAVDGSSQCFTGTVSINTADTYVLDAACIRTQEVDESNPLLAILDVFNNQMSCICYVVVPNAQDDRQMVAQHCGLRVTRCPRSLTIPANVVTTQTNF